MRQKIFGTFGLKILFTGLSFVTSILLARILGSEAYGIYTYTNTWILLLGILGGLGLRNVLVREIAIYQANFNPGLLRGLIRWSNIIVSLVSLAIVTITAMIIWLFVYDYSQQLAWYFWITLAMLPFLTLSSLRQGAMQGLGKLVMGEIPETLLQPILFLILLTVSWFFLPETQNLYLILAIKLFTMIIAFIVGNILLSKTLMSVSKVDLLQYTSSKWAKSIVPFLLIGLTHTINHKTDTLMLGYIQAPEVVGIYSVASRGAGIINFILVAVNSAIAPIIAQLYAANSLNQLQKLITKSSQKTFIISLLAASCFALLGTWFLRLFGSEFIQGYRALVILCIAQVFNAFIGSVGILLDMTGHEKDSAVGISISSVGNIILNTLLIPRWGMEGAATATALSIVIWNIYLTICVYQRLKIIPSPLGGINMSS